MRISQQYQKFDLTLLSLLGIACEVLSRMLFRLFPGAGFFISFSYLILFLALVRWGLSGLAVSAAVNLAGAFFLEGAPVIAYPIFLIAGLGPAVAVLVFQKYSAEELRQDSVKLWGYFLSVYLSIVLVKSVFSVMLGEVFIPSFVSLFLQGLLSILMGGGVLVLLRNKEGLLSDMREWCKKQEGGE